jgi:hypothetical protein
MDEHSATENPLAAYLRDRRTKLDPAALGLPADRRRTPGLRREEVAQRALMLTDVEREHLFLLGLGRPPDVRYRKNAELSPRLQRVLDALDPSPALIRTATWDVVAWNRAATVMLMDYAAIPPERRRRTGRAWPGSSSVRSEWRRRARAPPLKWNRSSKNSAGSVPSSRRCGPSTAAQSIHYPRDTLVN